MSQVIRQANRLAWEDRAVYGRDSGARRQKWCVDQWTRRGEITSAGNEAAHRYRGWLEAGAGAAPNLDRVDKGRPDPHAALLSAMAARRQAEAVSLWMRRRLRPKHREAFDLLFAFPQPTAGEMCAALRRNTPGAISAVAFVLELLALRLDMMDREARGWNASAKVD